MKVLYIANYKDGTGWGNSAQAYILALDAAGVDVVPRHIKLNPVVMEVPERIKELEAKDTSGCDIVIQQVLPTMLDYRGEFERNIAMYFVETDGFERSGWQHHINKMTEAIVACRDAKSASYSSGVGIPVNIWPVPCDISRYSQRWDKVEFQEMKDKFVFYFIGEVTRRKNLVALLKAFHLEFELDEPVGLVIKANYPGLSPSDCSQKITEMSREVKQQLKKFKEISLYKGEIIIAQTLTNEQIMQLHAGCDCFVMPSFGEGWNLPAFDAMAMGNTPICTNQGGMKDFLRVPDNDEVAGWLIEGTSEPCFGMAGCSVPELYTGMENWQAINVNMLRHAMREAFENKELRKHKAALGIDRAYDFSYQEVGRSMKEYLENGTPELPNRHSKIWENYDCQFMGQA